MRLLVFWSGILGVLLFVTSVIVGGFQIPDYSHLSQYISESYATGTPYGEVLRYAGFIPSGILLLIFSITAIKLLPKSPLIIIGLLGIGIFYGGGTIVCGLFPCDEGCNRDGISPSISQLIHNFSGSLTYLIVPISLILVGAGVRKWDTSKQLSNLGIFAGVICVIFVGVLSANPVSMYAGFFQRIIESSVLGWIVLCSFTLRRF